MEAPVFDTHDFTILFTLETDASGTSMGVILLQNSHPIAYYSKAFYSRIQWASTYLHKLHAIMSVIRKCCWTTPSSSSQIVAGDPNS